MLPSCSQHHSPPPSALLPFPSRSCSLSVCVIFCLSCSALSVCFACLGGLMRELMAYSRMCPVGRVEDGASGDGRLAALNSCVCHVLLMPLACFALKASFSGDPFTHNGCCYASVHILHTAFVCLFISLIPVLSAMARFQWWCLAYCVIFKFCG